MDNSSTPTLSQLPFAEGKAVALAEDSFVIFCISIELKVLKDMRTPMVLDPLQLLEVEKNVRGNVRPLESSFAPVEAVQAMESQDSELVYVRCLSEVEEHVCQ